MRSIYSTGLTSLLVGLWVIHTCSAALPNGAHNAEEEPQSVKPTNGNRLFNRAIRGPHNNAQASRLAKNQPTSQKVTPGTPPPPPTPPVEIENKPEAGVEEGQEVPEVEANPIEETASSSSTTTTEAPTRKQTNAGRQSQVKKDFLERIEKRRKLQQQKGFSSLPYTTTTSTTEKPSTKTTLQNGRKTSHSKPPTPTIPTFVNQGSQKKSGSNRRYSAKAVTPIQTTPLPELPSNEAIAEESNVATQSAKIRTYPKARRTSSN